LLAAAIYFSWSNIYIFFNRSAALSRCGGWEGQAGSFAAFELQGRFVWAANVPDCEGLEGLA